MRPRQAAVSLSALLLLGTGLGAEPIFLGRQYNRCTACHYSPTGGGLLTPYGRSLSRQELSTTGRSDPSVQAAPGKGEEAFLFGALGDALGPVSLGIDLRPSHLSLGTGPTGTDRNLLMTADLLAAWRSHGWTVYGEFGRQPRIDETKWDSYEHWVGFQSEKGLGFRVGRFLPAYGIRFADHTAYTRAGLGLTIYAALTLGALTALQNFGSRRWAAYRQASAEQFGFLEERIAGTEDIRAVGAEEYVLHGLYARTRAMLRYGRRVFTAQSLSSVITNFLFVAGYGLGLGLGAYLYTQQAVSIGTVQTDDIILLNITGGGLARVKEDYSLHQLQPDITVAASRWEDAVEFLEARA